MQTGIVNACHTVDNNRARYRTVLNSTGTVPSRRNGNFATFFFTSKKKALCTVLVLLR